MNNKKVIVVLLVIIMILAGFLRLWRVDFDLAYPYHPDEVFFIEPVFRIMEGNQPGWYGAPGTTLIYTNTLIFYTVGAFTDGSGTVMEKYENNPLPFDLTARIFYELIGLATVLLVYFLTSKIFQNKQVGLLAALVLALSALHVEHSHYIRPDILATFFLVLVAYLGWYIYKQGNLKYYLWAGIFLALAVVTKYPAIIGVLFIVIAHIIRFYKYKEGKFINKKIIFAGIMTLIIFTIIFPYYLTDTAQLKENLLWEASSDHGDASGQGFLGNMGFYLQGNLWYTGTLIFIFTLIGMIVSFIKNRNRFVYLFSFIIIFLVFISTLSLQWDRWLIMALPFFCIFSGYGIYYVLKFFKKYLQKKLVVYYLLCSVILLMIFYPALIRSIRQSYALGHKDTRDISREWIINNLDSSKSVVIDYYGPVLKNYFHKVERLPTSSVKFPDYWKDEAGMDYQIVNSWIYDRIIYGADFQQYYRDSYMSLFNGSTLIKSFYYFEDQHRDMAITINDFEILFNKDIFNFKSASGPEIKIYEL